MQSNAEVFSATVNFISRRSVHDAFHVQRSACGDQIAGVIEKYTAPNYHWRGMHPFYKQHNAGAVKEVFWEPFRKSSTSIKRRQDVSMAGINDVASFSTKWVCSTGHLTGLFNFFMAGDFFNGQDGILALCGSAIHQFLNRFKLNTSG